MPLPLIKMLEKTVVYKKVKIVSLQAAAKNGQTPKMSLRSNGCTFKAEILFNHATDISSQFCRFLLK